MKLRTTPCRLIRDFGENASSLDIREGPVLDDQKNNHLWQLKNNYNHILKAVINNYTGSKPSIPS